MQIQNKIYGTVYALEENLEVIRKCIVETDLIDWQRLFQISALPKRCAEVIKPILSANGYTDIINFSEICQLNYMPIDQIKNFSIPR